MHKIIPPTPSRRVISAKPLLGALDLGTNNCRLLIARPVGDEFDVVDSFSRIVRLGEGVAASGRLAQGAMRRTIAALKVCARLIARHGVQRSRCVATEACRQAVNTRDFLSRVHKETGLVLNVLAHQEEAHLALLGCLPLMDRVADDVLLIDIGGGSTELVWLRREWPQSAPGLRCAWSVPIGVVSLTESFSAEPDDATYALMKRHVGQFLAHVEAAHRIGPATAGRRFQMLGTSGTVTTLAAVHLDLPRYDRRRIDGLVFDPRMIAVISNKLRAMTAAERSAHPCIGHGRADLVLAGCAILDAVLAIWRPDHLRVADRGLREGILHSLMGRTLDQALVNAGAGMALYEDSDRAG